jgi:hypothetical protein
MLIYLHVNCAPKFKLNQVYPKKYYAEKRRIQENAAVECRMIERDGYANTRQ